jgi:metal-responsive CopG/Arc/MetJ family transcriptional regulator
MVQDSKEKQYVNVLFEEQMLKKIDEFRWKHRISSRTEAIRWLIGFALEQEPKPPVDEEQL